MTSAGLERLNLNDGDSDVEGLFDSPPKQHARPERIAVVNKSTASIQGAQHDTVATRSEKTSREDALRAELAQLQQMNTTLEGLNQSLGTARDNLQTMQVNMDSAKTLLKTWSRILSQAEHDQRLILNSRWQGATQDLEDVAKEDMRREAEAQRREQEEIDRRAVLQQKQEDEARRREAEESKRARGMGRTRSVRGAGVGSHTRGQASVSSRGRGVPARGATSGIARGAAIRGRGRGT